MNRICMVLFSMNNRIFGPYLAARTLISVSNAQIPSTATSVHPFVRPSASSVYPCSCASTRLRTLLSPPPRPQTPAQILRHAGTRRHQPPVSKSQSVGQSVSPALDATSRLHRRVSQSVSQSVRHSTPPAACIEESVSRSVSQSDRPAWTA
jgi:hypothetical protein